MADTLAEYFRAVEATDLLDYGRGYPQRDFLEPWPRDRERPDWIITNPPYRVATDFALKAVRVAREGVALLCRIQFAEGLARYRTLYSVRRPSSILVFVSRVPMMRGRLAPPGTATTATHAWFVWYRAGDRSTCDSTSPTLFDWLHGDRAALDFPPAGAIEAGIAEPIPDPPPALPL